MEITKVSNTEPYKLLDGITEAKALDIAHEIFEKGGITSALNGPNIANYILDRDMDRILDFIGYNPDNKYSSLVFTALTGIKLQRTIKARCAQLDEWAGITPDVRGSLNIHKKEIQRTKALNKELRSHWDDLARLFVQDATGSDMTVDQFILEKIKAGYTAIGTSGKQVGLVNRDVLEGKRNDIPMFITLKSANFRRFCKLVAKIDPINFDALKVITDAGLLLDQSKLVKQTLRQKM